MKFGSKETRKGGNIKKKIFGWQSQLLPFSLTHTHGERTRMTTVYLITWLGRVFELVSFFSVFLFLRFCVFETIRYAILKGKRYDLTKALHFLPTVATTNNLALSFKVLVYFLPLSFC